MTEPMHVEGAADGPSRKRPMDVVATTWAEAPAAKRVIKRDLQWYKEHCVMHFVLDSTDKAIVLLRTLAGIFPTTVVFLMEKGGLVMQHMKGGALAFEVNLKSLTEYSYTPLEGFSETQHVDLGFFNNTVSMMKDSKGANSAVVISIPKAETNVLKVATIGGTIKCSEGTVPLVYQDSDIYEFEHRDWVVAVNMPSAMLSSVGQLKAPMSALNVRITVDATSITFEGLEMNSGTILMTYDVEGDVHRKDDGGGADGEAPLSIVWSPGVAPQTFSRIYSLEYLIDCAKARQVSSRVTMYLVAKGTMVLEYVVGTMGNLKFWIAPNAETSGAPPV